MKLNVDDIQVTSYQTSVSDPSSAALAACTPTLDSLVDHLCPDGITVGCHETTVPALA